MEINDFDEKSWKIDETSVWNAGEEDRDAAARQVPVHVLRQDERPCREPLASLRQTVDFQVGYLCGVAWFSGVFAASGEEDRDANDSRRRRRTPTILQQDSESVVRSWLRSCLLEMLDHYWKCGPSLLFAFVLVFSALATHHARTAERIARRPCSRGQAPGRGHLALQELPEDHGRRRVDLGHGPGHHGPRASQCGQGWTRGTQ